MNNPTKLFILMSAIFLLFIGRKLFKKPLQFIFKTAIHCAFGLGIMCLINTLFSSYGQIFSLNPTTAVISGILGIPGIILSAILRIII